MTTFSESLDTLWTMRRKEESDNDFAQVLLHHWLTGLWWLMPLSAVGAEIARIQGKPDAGDMIRKFNQRLRKIRTRKPEDASGKFFSQGWNGCFHSTHPPLIDCIEENGCPLLNATGRRLLR